MTEKRKPDFERYLTALNCREPDRVPLGDFYMDLLAKERFLGRKLVTLEDEVEFWTTAGFDFVPSPAGLIEVAGALTAKPGITKTAEGEEVTRQWMDEHAGIITTWEQFEKFQWPSVDEFNFPKWETFGKILPSGMKAVAVLGRIYTTVWMLMGADTFYGSLESNEALVSAMFETVGRIQYVTLLRLLDYPSIGAIVNPDDIAHNAGWLIHPKYFRKYIFPWYKKMATECRNKGVGFVLHSDGDCTDAMDDIIECGFQGFNPIQPNCMDIVEVKKRWGKSICLIGNINLDSTLTLGSPQDVRAEVYERIRTIAPGGGYMMASSNSITDYVPLENMKALFDATFEFGKYPIDLKEGVIKGKIWKYYRKTKLTDLEQPEELDVAGYMSALLGANENSVVELAEKDIIEGHTVSDVVSKGLIPGMVRIGEQFQNGTVYIPEMILSAKRMAAALLHFKKQLAGTGDKDRGKVVIGTV